MAQLGEKPHGFKDLDFLMVLKKAAVDQQVISHKAVSGPRVRLLVPRAVRDS